MRFNIETAKKSRMRIRVNDPYQNYTYFTDRWIDVDGRQPIYVRMPLAPDIAQLAVHSESTGLGPESSDNTFRISKPEVLNLEPRFDKMPYMDGKLRRFIRFVNDWSMAAGLLSAGGGSTYYSKDKEFRIDYFDMIRDSNGNVMTTPARTSQQDGRIEAAKERFKYYTVPGRVAVLHHEGAHFYFNDVMNSEEEADYRSLLTYLALGFPRIEAHQVWLEIFKTTPSPHNLERYKKMESLIQNFDKT